MDDFEAFLRWHSGPLLETRNRSAYAEWLVHRALDLDPGEHRSHGHVLKLGEGELSLAVQSAAYVQAGTRERGEAIRFAIEPQIVSAWVFCLLAEEDPERADPRQEEQWRFWLVPSRALHAGRQSIGLQALRRAHGEGCGYEQLPALLAALRASSGGRNAVQ